jgi:hypothetical protein
VRWARKERKPQLRLVATNRSVKIYLWVSGEVKLKVSKILALHIAVLLTPLHYQYCAVE